MKEVKTSNIKKITKKVKSVNKQENAIFAIGKIKPENVFPAQAYVSLKNAFDKQQEYIKLLEGEFHATQNRNRELAQAVERKMNIAWTERFIIAFLWAVSVFIVYFMK